MNSEYDNGRVTCPSIQLEIETDKSRRGFLEQLEELSRFARSVDEVGKELKIVEKPSVIVREKFHEVFAKPFAKQQQGNLLITIYKNCGKITCTVDSYCYTLWHVANDSYNTENQYNESPVGCLQLDDD